MEQKEKEPIRKRRIKKRRSRQNSVAQEDMQNKMFRENGDTSQEVVHETCKPSNFHVADDFDRLNDSDLLLAEVDIGSVPSLSLESSIDIPTNKRKCLNHHAQNDSKTSLKNGELIQTYVENDNGHTISKTHCESDHKEAHNSLQADDTFSNTNGSCEDLFDENIQSNNDINSSCHDQNFCTDRKSNTEEFGDDSLSEYFFINKQENGSVSKDISSNKVTFDADQDANNCANNSILNPLSLPMTSDTVVESASHLVSDNSSEARHSKASSSISESVSTKDKMLVLNSESLRSKVKKRLQQNVGSVTLFRSTEENLKQDALFQAKLDASQIRKEGTKVDIGPFYGLPSKVQQLFEANRGITKLYGWQDECLQLKAIKERKNLIYTLPTSGGKTLVAEILIMRELLCYERDALLVVPFVSIVQEKVRTISEFATELGFIVEEYAGSKGRFPPIKRQKKKSLYIATIEKAHSLVNSLIETERIESLGLVVVDELHMIGEGGSRGAALEAMLLKLVSNFKTHIIGMSATLNNIQDLQDFLHAELFTNNFRPVILKERIKIEDNIFSINHEASDEDGKLQHDKTVTFLYSSELLRKDPDHLLGLVMEIIPDSSCLMFCATKKHCENVAKMLSKLMESHQSHLAAVKKDERRQLLKELYQDGEGKICPVLRHTVQFGIAYHHSGLTTDERHLIEEAYSEGTLCLLTCTSTLAAGVNLPAKRVILRSPYVGSSFIKYSQYKQMTGRAGRAGIDTSGESILIIKSEDKTKVKELIEGPKDMCHSSLAYDGMKGIKSLLLSTIGLKIVSSTKSASEFMRKSLLHIQAPALNVNIDMAVKESLQYLIDQKLVIQSKTDGQNDLGTQDSLSVSLLGRATYKGSVDHIHSGKLYTDLKTAEESLNLATHLHLLYLVTPYDVTVNIDWRVYFSQYSKLSERELKVTSLIGVPEQYIGLRAAGRSSKKKICEATVGRFYLTLMLWNLWNQKSVWEVAEKFSQPRGFIQNLMSQSVAFASCVFHFCQELDEFWAYQDLFGNFVKRLAYCVTSELIPLMEIPGVKLVRARQLYAAGFRNLSILAGADRFELVRNIEHLSVRAAGQIIAAAKNRLEEKTAALMEEVESLAPVPSSAL